MHCIATVALPKQLNFKSAVIRSNRPCFCRFVGDQTQASTRPNFESRNLWCLLAKSCWNNKSHLQYWLSREKIKKPSARQKLYFFTRNLPRNIYMFIFVWIVDEMTFSRYFFLRGQQKRLSLNRGTGNRAIGQWEWGTGNGESLKWGIFKSGNL